jgi:hypothetical protein
MPHKVTFRAPARELGKADVVFKVHDENGIIGTLKISRGSLVWFPSDTVYGHRIGWGDFNKLVKKNVKGVEVRKQPC